MEVIDRAHMQYFYTSRDNEEINFTYACTLYRIY